MTTESKLATLKQDLRSVLIAEKNGIEIQYLQKEFASLTGSEIEFDSKLYSSLYEFLQSIPDACYLKQQGFETRVFAIATEKQLHIQELVLNQRDKRPNQRRFSRGFRDLRSDPSRQILGKFDRGGIRKPFFESANHRNLDRNFSTRRPPILDSYRSRSFAGAATHRRIRSPLGRRRSPSRREISSPRRRNLSPTRSIRSAQNAINRRKQSPTPENQSRSSRKRKRDLSPGEIDSRESSENNDNKFHRNQNDRKTTQPCEISRSTCPNESFDIRKSEKVIKSFDVRASISSTENFDVRTFEPVVQSFDVRKITPTVESYDVRKVSQLSNSNNSPLEKKNPNKTPVKISSQTKNSDTIDISRKEESITQPPASQSSSRKVERPFITRDRFVDNLKNYLTTDSSLSTKRNNKKMETVCDKSVNESVEIRSPSRRKNESPIEKRLDATIKTMNRSFDVRSSDCKEINVELFSPTSNYTQVQPPPPPPPLVLPPKPPPPPPITPNARPSQPIPLQSSLSPDVIPLDDFESTESTPRSAPRLDPRLARRALDTSSSLRVVTNDAVNKNVPIETNESNKIEFNKDLIRRMRDFSPDYRKNEQHSLDSSHLVTLFSPLRHNSLDSSACSFRSEDDLSSISSDHEINNVLAKKPQTAKRSKVPIVIDNQENSHKNAKLIRLCRQYTQKSDVELESKNNFNELEIYNLDKIVLRNLRQSNLIMSNLESCALEKNQIRNALSALPKTMESQELYIANKEAVQYDNFVLDENFDSKINYKLRLKKFIKKTGLQHPIYEPGLCMNDHGLAGYFCNLLIGDKNWCTVLKTHKTPNDAENSVAKVALNDLQLSCEKNSETIDNRKNEDLIGRITKLFNDKNENLYTSILEKRYADVYKRDLDSGWLDSLRSSGAFEVKECNIENISFHTVQLAS